MNKQSDTNPNSSYKLFTDDYIRSGILLIRNVSVMIDSDLALLYNVTTGNLNKAVKRNIGRFPPDFTFQLTKEEFNVLIFQNGISNI
ncbi:MAG: ORF6N domain-containing protein [Sphingobacteriales bacterium]